MFLVCSLLLFIPFPADDQVDLYAFISTIVVFLTGFPLLGVCLFIDALRIREAEVEWNPNPFLYGVPALFQYSLLTDQWIPEPVPDELFLVGPSLVSVVYLIQRFRHVGFR